ncbi:MAG TPA: hypothetical protein VK941_10970 [Gillisia sp.]|nr:hypothetical protein [Gillisia sp.]
MKFTNPPKVFYSLTGIILLLLILNIASYFHFFLNDLTPRDYFFRKTNFNIEKNLPSIFAGVLHFIAAFYLALIAKTDLKMEKTRVFWWAMSAIFIFLGLDEILRIHERIEGGATFFDETFSFFLYNWIVYYGIALIILGIIFIKPLLSLPRKTLYQFIAAGLIFVTGAIGIENLTGHIISHHHLPESEIINSPLIFTLYTIEELLEMMGVAYFIYAMLRFLQLYKASAIPKRALTFSK